MHLIYALTISSTPAALDFFFVALSSTDLSSLSTIVPLCNEKQGILNTRSKPGGSDLLWFIRWFKVVEPIHFDN